MDNRYKQKEYSSTLDWLHEQLSPRRRISSATSAKSHSSKASSRVDPIQSGIGGIKLGGTPQRPMTSVSQRAETTPNIRSLPRPRPTSSICRPQSAKTNRMPPRQ